VIAPNAIGETPIARAGQHHGERHRYDRVNWLRAAVLGAGDGIVSTASLLIGVAASDAARSSLIIAGVAGLVAGAMSMATGEYNSVSSQRDTERADIARERREQRTDPLRELDELTEIYVWRGLDRALAREVATELSKADPLGAHLRDELGIVESQRARPVQAALVSAAAFAAAAMIPLLAVIVSTSAVRIPVLVSVTLVSLAALGVGGARLGGAPPLRAAVRVVVGSGVAMAVTAAIGALVGTVV
jgi:VIT1/CCC1 family predicted Fe2+/Mn2+ transporter